jgi:hypothetical protein
VARAGAGVCIRAARRPPIGLASHPSDLGALPAVAVALKKVRGSGEEGGRFDALTAGPFENG